MSRFKLPALGGLVAAAAAIIVLVQNPGDDDGWDGTKGGHIAFLVKDAGDTAHRGTEGEQLANGDRIQFEVRDAPKSNMIVVGIDGKGEVTLYAVESIESERPKGLVKPRPLPTSVVLDDSTGAERFFVVYADGDIDSVKSRVESAARSLATSGKSLVDTRVLPLDKAYVQDSVHIVKVSR